MATGQSGSTNSLLTAAQREYLRGESNIEARSAHERNMRTRIRSRLRSSFADFPLLRELEDRDRKEVFRPPEDAEPFDINPTVGALPDAIAFFYLGVSDQYTDAEEVEREFSYIVRNGIRGAVARQGWTVENVTVNIEVERGAPLPAGEEPLSQMDGDVLQQLLTAGQITREDFADEIHRRKEE